MESWGYFFFFFFLGKEEKGLDLLFSEVFLLKTGLTVKLS